MACLQPPNTPPFSPQASSSILQLPTTCQIPAQAWTFEQTYLYLVPAYQTSPLDLPNTDLESIPGSFNCSKNCGILITHRWWRVSFGVEKNLQVPFDSRIPKLPLSLLYHLYLSSINPYCDVIALMFGTLYSWYVCIYVQVYTGD